MTSVIGTPGAKRSLLRRSSVSICFTPCEPSPTKTIPARPTLLQALVRTVLMVIVITAITYDENGRGIHERLSKTKIALAN